MPRPPPDHRARAVLAAARGGDPRACTHAYEAALLGLVLGGADGGLPEVREALELHASEEHRHVLNAAILGKAPDALLAEALDLAPTSAAAYRHLFFDRAVFPHALAAFAYVEGLPLDATRRQVYEIATRQGPDALLARYRIGRRPTVDPRAVLQTLLGDQFDRALQHRGQQLTSEAAAAALAWSKEALRTASVLLAREGGDGAGAATDFRLALATTDATRSAEAAGVALGELVTE